MNTAAVRHEPDELTGPFGMWVFLASEVLFFGGLLLAYTYGRSHWPEGFAAASRETHVVIGTVNTALLLTSSALVAMAVACGESRESRRYVSALLWGASALGVAFMVLKGMEYTREFHEHLVPGAAFRLQEPGAQLFYVLYFLATGLHAVHLTIGIAVLATFAWGTHRLSGWALPRRVEVAGLYWHFVDVVWIFLYPLIYLGGRSG
ncbi:cytochrome c oxidase subunit 3 [Ramlibacter humi]|uniref:Cytochrome c oxidase subunit 3 family protein n=1 Tax=Ramlibacter humi TaxID=2530451 RepID=A0A4Z0BD30_9BURK|nr:cytochrome c oxidase subunit 3 [Ramlibacter humi]TFY97206.1 cytochrome c oxidase subunit 3 family protein [Ramlibacter humi]